MSRLNPVEIMRATDAIGKIGATFYFRPDTLAPASASLTDAQAASLVAGTAAIAAALGV